jgi:hypothetical protein
MGDPVRLRGLLRLFLFLLEVVAVELEELGGVADELPPLGQQGIAGDAFGAGDQQVVLVYP